MTTKTYKQRGGHVKISKCRPLYSSYEDYDKYYDPEQVDELYPECGICGLDMEKCTCYLEDIEDYKDYREER